MKKEFKVKSNRMFNYLFDETFLREHMTPILVESSNNEDVLLKITGYLLRW